MNKYRVRIKYNRDSTVIVEADSIEEAEMMVDKDPFGFPYETDEETQEVYVEEELGSA